MGEVTFTRKNIMVLFTNLRFHYFSCVTPDEVLDQMAQKQRKTRNSPLNNDLYPI